jgi:phosphomevalonate kinase
MMVVGEYAVLRGARAVVAAVDRRAFVAWAGETGPNSLPPEVVAARREAEARLGALPGGLAFDPAALRSADKKLGLGSSAAGAAAAAGAVYHVHGHDLTREAARQAVLECAFAGHAAVAPRGSGADVAASVLGGYVSFKRLFGAPQPPQPQPGSVWGPNAPFEAASLAWPEALLTRVVWTRQEARTSDFLDRVEALASQDPATHERRMQELAELSARFVERLQAGDSAAIPPLASAYGEAMGKLGEAAGIGIMTDTLKRTQELADRAGGGAKPSGAGGGDVALAFFADPESAERFVTSCSASGLEVLSMALGAEGVRSESETIP